MPLFVRLSNLVLNKEILEEKYEGGLKQFKIDYSFGEYEYDQEDEELLCISKMNPDEHSLTMLIQRGLDFDSDKQFSKDFAIVSRYGGSHWKVDWIEDNVIFVWHKNCDPKLLEEAENRVKITINQLQDLHEQGFILTSTITQRTITFKDWGKAL